MFFVYALSSQSRNYIYVGITDNVERRVLQHNSGYEKTTRAYRPFELILQEEFTTRQAARSREKYLKSGVGRSLLKKSRTIVNKMVDGEARVAGHAGLPSAGKFEPAYRRKACLP